ncbi:hypothetical protein [Kribbella ginsengisoli]|uniref:hypothetical protein n=1 Tax=Kribbella ginsengisoli TaxID=363865 RepID=UPI0031D06016
MASAGASATWDSFLNWMARGLADFSATVFNAFSTSTTPQFNQEWWTKNLDLMVMISLPVLVAVFVLQCISAAVRREPARLGRALVGALIGTAGVPVAIAVMASCGKIVDEISVAILGSQVTADKLRWMTDTTVLLSAGTLGGFLLLAIFMTLVAMLSLYFVMLLRDVALIAFGIFVPIALLSWTWSAIRHWLRRYIEVIAALLFSKIAMAVVFAVGISASGADNPASPANLGDFLAGALLVAMAAFAPMVTFSFIHWAGDQGYVAAQAMQQGAAGAAAARGHVDQALQFKADQFGGSNDGETTPISSSDTDVADDVDDDSANSSNDAPGGQFSGPVGSDGSPTAESPTAPSSGGGSAIAVATSQVSVEGPSGDEQSSSQESSRGDET